MTDSAAEAIRGAAGLPPSSKRVRLAHSRKSFSPRWARNQPGNAGSDDLGAYAAAGAGATAGSHSGSKPGRPASADGLQYSATAVSDCGARRISGAQGTESPQVPLASPSSPYKEFRVYLETPPDKKLPKVAAPPIERRSKIAKRGRKWEWMKSARGGYLDTMPHYFSTTPEELRTSLSKCHHFWVEEKAEKAEATRWRGTGCGRREVCPLCGTYRQQALAEEAWSAMQLAMDGVEVMEGVKLESYGMKTVLSLRKDVSQVIDGLLVADAGAWVRKMSQFYHATYRWVNEFFGEGCGGVVAPHFTGESNPAEAHYHQNVYIAPARRVGGKWIAIPHWITKRQLKHGRERWLAILKEELGVDYEVADIEVQHLSKVGQYRGWMQYLYKHQLDDLWSGWDGVREEFVKYHYCKSGIPVYTELAPEDLEKIASRIQSIPRNFKRIRWFGIFSDGNRGATMEGLGLRAEDVEESQGPAEETNWKPTGKTAQFVRFTRDGMVLRNEEGEFEVKEESINYRPAGVAIGRRKRWHEPGGRG